MTFCLCHGCPSQNFPSLLDCIQVHLQVRTFAWSQKGAKQPGPNGAQKGSNFGELPPDAGKKVSEDVPPQNVAMLIRPGIPVVDLHHDE